MSDTQWLIVCQSPPQGDPLAIAGLDAAMAGGAFGQSVQLLFVGAGVNQLAQDVAALEGERNISKTIAGLPLYDVDTLFVSASDWAKLKNKREDIDVQPIDDSAIAELLVAATHTLSF